MPLTRKPSRARIKADIRNSGKQGVRSALGVVQARHQAIVQPWEKSEDKPEFKIEIEEKHRLVIGLVKMIGEAAESARITVWQLLEHGTDIRFMKLSPDWASKTRPGSLSSGPGAGHKIGLDFEDAKPGIEARGWSEGVADETRDEVGRRIKEGWANGFRRGIG